MMRRYQLPQATLSFWFFVRWLIANFAQLEPVAIFMLGWELFEGVAEISITEQVVTECPRYILDIWTWLELDNSRRCHDLWICQECTNTYHSQKVRIWFVWGEQDTYLGNLPQHELFDIEHAGDTPRTLQGDSLDHWCWGQSEHWHYGDIWRNRSFLLRVTPPKDILLDWCPTMSFWQQPAFVRWQFQQQGWWQE